jgi:hypothetical protein
MMVETDLSLIEDARPRGWHFEWTFPIFFRPARTLKAISEKEHGVWLTPLTLLSLLAILFVLVGGPVRTTTAQVGAEIPQDFQYWSQDQQQQYLNGQANKTSPLFIYIFPSLLELAGVWIPWLLLSLILNLSLTLNGSRGNGTGALNLAGWAFMPFALRYIVRGISLLATHSAIQAAGLSGFVDATAGGFLAFLRPVLEHIDFYWMWMILLLMLGVLPLTGLSKGKAWLAVFITVVIVLALQALPGYIGTRLTGIAMAPSPLFF